MVQPKNPSAGALRAAKLLLAQINEASGEPRMVARKWAMVIDLETEQHPGDDIRGIRDYHSRVHPATESEFDRLVASDGHPAPWHADPNAEPADDDGEIQAEMWRPVLRFLNRLARMSGQRQHILFARLRGLSFEEIGDSIMGVHERSKQAAEQEFAAILSALPALKRAFPETKNQDQE